MDIPLPICIESAEELQQVASDLTTAIQTTIQEKVKLNKPCPHSKRWWNSDLRQLKKELNKLSRTCMRQRAVPDHPCHRECKTKANKYGEAILKEKCQHWMEFLEDVADNDLWTANSYIKELTGDGGKTHIPTLKVIMENGNEREVNSNKEKAEIFSNAFSPPNQRSPQYRSTISTSHLCKTPQTSPEIRSVNRLEDCLHTRPVAQMAYQT